MCLYMSSCLCVCMIADGCLWWLYMNWNGFCCLVPRQLPCKEASNHLVHNQPLSISFSSKLPMPLTQSKHQCYHGDSIELRIMMNMQQQSTFRLESFSLFGKEKIDNGLFVCFFVWLLVFIITRAVIRKHWQISFGN